MLPTGPSHGPPRVWGAVRSLWDRATQASLREARRRTPGSLTKLSSVGSLSNQGRSRGLERQTHLFCWTTAGIGKLAALAEDSTDAATLPLTVGTGGHPGIPVVRGLEWHHSWAHGGAERLYLTGTTYRSWSLGRWRLLGWKGPMRKL